MGTSTVRLANAGMIEDLAGYAEGAWWVQDLAATLPARVLAARPGERVLDLCAAPGGKTAQLAAAGAEVTSVERDPTRAGRLEENLQRLHLPARVVVASITRYVPEAPFPCGVARCALHRHRHAAPASGHHVEQGLLGYRDDGEDAAAALGQERRVRGTGRAAGLCGLLDGAGGRAAGGRRLSRRQPGLLTTADPAGRDGLCLHRGRRSSHPPSLAGRCGWAGWFLHRAARPRRLEVSSCPCCVPPVPCFPSPTRRGSSISPRP